MITNVAIIGSGFGLYGLLPSFHMIHGCKVNSICGKNSERMQNYCDKFGLRRYEDWKEMLQKEKPDAVAIAVIPKFQYGIAKYALEHEIAVFAEKPLTTSLETSQELNQLAEKKNLPNMLDFIFPEIPEWQMAKKIIESGLVGKICNINTTWTFLSYDLKNHIQSWKTDVKQGGGALSFYFSHVFYYLENFIGKIKNIQCIFSTSEKNLNLGETSVTMNILFENGCLGNAHLNISDTGSPIHKIEFISKNKSIILQNFGNNLVDDFELKIKTSTGIQKIKPDSTYDIKDIELEDPRIKVVIPIAKRFIHWCNTGIPSKPDFQDGLRIQELIQMARTNSNF